jgi:hypothetical protein
VVLRRELGRYQAKVHGSQVSVLATPIEPYLRHSANGAAACGNGNGPRFATIAGRRAEAG